MGRKVKETVQSQEIKSDLHGKTFDYNASQVEVDSGVKLQDDEGSGSAAVIRQFLFKANLETFRNNPPTKQELFNAHLKQIELALWRDGLKVFPDISPRLTFSKDGQSYRIIVGAKPMRGQLLTQTPNLLKDFAPNS